MPPILKRFKGGSVQKKEIFHDNLSCQFDVRQVDRQETVNKEYAGCFKLRASLPPQHQRTALLPLGPAVHGH